MIHVDVRPARGEDETPFRFIVESSVDGSPWVRQFYANTRETAELVASAYIAGLRFAGAEARATSYGEAL